jgi:hypothetical protein
VVDFGKFCTGFLVVMGVGMLHFPFFDGFVRGRGGEGLD